MKSAALALASVLLAACVGTAFAEEAKPAAKPDLAKGQATSTNVCAACHTNDGSRGSAANPILQGQHAEYLVKQLKEFKAGAQPAFVSADRRFSGGRRRSRPRP